jgi:hypothetical protein
MKKMSLAVAVVLGLVPGMVLAGPSCSGDTHQSSSACSEGQIYDEATKACVTKPTS